MCEHDYPGGDTSQEYFPCSARRLSLLGRELPRPRLISHLSMVQPLSGMPAAFAELQGSALEWHRSPLLQPVAEPLAIPSPKLVKLPASGMGCRALCAGNGRGRFDRRPRDDARDGLIH